MSIENNQSNSDSQKSDEVNNNVNKNSSSTVLDEDDEWMIRPCDIYYDEYDDCMSIKGRFHQYFIFGEMQNCNPWKRDYDNCCRWKNKKDEKAKMELINSEKERRFQRLKAHYNNDTWKERKEPPKDWNNPLPEWIQKRDENTYLHAKALEIKSENNFQIEPKKTYCSIM